jgi:hypothetical protein
MASMPSVSDHFVNKDPSVRALYDQAPVENSQA